MYPCAIPFVAGCYFPGPFKLVKGNLEQTMAVNYFAPAFLTLSLLDKVSSSGEHKEEGLLDDRD